MKWLRMGIQFWGRNFTSQYTPVDQNPQSISWNMMNGDYILIKVWNILFANNFNTNKAWGDWYGRIHTNNTYDSTFIWKLTCRQPNNDINAQPYLEISMLDQVYLNGGYYNVGKRHVLRSVVMNTVDDRQAFADWNDKLPQDAGYNQTTFMYRLVGDHYANYFPSEPLHHLPYDFGHYDYTPYINGLIKNTPMAIVTGDVTSGFVSNTLLSDYKDWAINPGRNYNAGLGWYGGIGGTFCNDVLMSIENGISNGVPFYGSGNHQPVPWNYTQQDYLPLWAGYISNRGSTPKYDKILSIISGASRNFFAQDKTKLLINTPGWWIPTDTNNSIPDFLNYYTNLPNDSGNIPYQSMYTPIPYINGTEYFGNDDEYMYGAASIWQISDTDFTENWLTNTRPTATTNVPDFRNSQSFIPSMSFICGRDSDLAISSFVSAQHQNSPRLGLVWSKIGSLYPTYYRYSGSHGVYTRQDFYGAGSIDGSMGIRVQTIQGTSPTSQTTSPTENGKAIDCVILPSTYWPWPALDIYGCRPTTSTLNPFIFRLNNTSISDTEIDPDNSLKSVQIFSTCRGF